jgi:hypothetical protein
LPTADSAFLELFDDDCDGEDDDDDDDDGEEDGVQGRKLLDDDDDDDGEAALCSWALVMRGRTAGGCLDCHLPGAGRCLEQHG